MQRCYSLSNAPGAAFYRISVKRVPDGRLSGWMHAHLQEGDLLLANAPAGGFHLQDGDSALVLVSGGIGITPMLSMLEHLHACGARRAVHFLHGSRNGRESAFAHRLRELASLHPQLRLQRWFSDPGAEDVRGRDYDHRGRLDAQALLSRLPPPPFDVYLCGPGTMMRDLVAALRAAGVAESAIHFEAFGPASTPVASSSPVDVNAAIPWDVQFLHSGKSMRWQPGTTLLELAETSGIGIASACRSGSCGTCQTRIVSGDVVYPQPPVYAPEPGHCLPCVCRPASALALDA